MKNIYLILVAIISFISCKAQSPILPLYNNSNFGDVENAYYKDNNNVHNQYVGTWLYNNGTTSLKIILKKKEMFHVIGDATNPTPDFYTDAVIGEYQYIENGVEKINTLSNIDINYPTSTDHNLYSFSLKRADSYPKCNECTIGEKVLRMNIDEPSRRHIMNLSRDFIIRRYFDNGIEKLKVWFILTGHGVYVDSNTNELSDISGFSLPYGEYVLTKIE